MDLYIDTSKKTKINIQLKDDNKLVAKKNFDAPFRQAEKLLLEIDKLLNVNNIDLQNISGILVKDRGESFTALRIGIVTANALAYALDIPVFDWDKKQTEKVVNINIIKPKYNKGPNITVAKKKI